MNKSLLQIIQDSISDYSPEKVQAGVINPETATLLMYDGVTFELLPESVKLYFFDTVGRKIWRSVELIHPSLNQKVEQKYAELLINRQINLELVAKEEQRRLEYSNRLKTVQSKLKANGSIELKKGFTDGTFTVNIIDITDEQVLKVAEVLKELKP